MEILNLESAQSSHTWQAVDAVSNGESVEECSKDGKDHDGDKVIKKGIIIKSQGSVQDNGRQENLKEERSCELRKGMLCLVLNVEDIIKDDIVNEDSSEDAHNDEDTGLWEYLG